MNQSSVKTIRHPEISNVNQEGKNNELLRFNGKINGHAAVILIDSGSTHDLISEEFLRRHQIQAVAGEGQIQTVRIGTNSLFHLESGHATLVEAYCKVGFWLQASLRNLGAQVLCL